MSSHYALSGQLRLAYETFGNAQHPAVILVMGLGAQMIAWPEAFCEGLAQRGYYVIRFDNRDIGQSDKLHHLRPPGLLSNILRHQLGLRIKTAYTLSDMARDVIGLMDWLKLKKAHLVGASMGGMISQIVATRFYGRVISLTSIMSAPEVPIPRRLPFLLPWQGPRKKHCPHADIQRRVNALTRLSGTALKTSPQLLTERLQRALARSDDDHAGTLRQTAAIMGTGSRHAELREIRVPTLIIHGGDDALIPKSYGIKTAQCIRQSQIELISGMGHDLPPAILNRLVSRISEHMDTAHYFRTKKRGVTRPFLF